MKKKWIIILLAITAAVISGIIFEKKEEVTVFDVRKGRVVKSIEESGTIKAEDQKNIYSKINGRITEIYKEEGDLIDRGTILAELDMKNTNFSEKELKEKINLLRSEYRINKRRIALNIERNETLFYEAKRIYKIKKTLYDEKYISKDEYQKAYAEYLIAEKKLIEVREEYKRYTSNLYVTSYESDEKVLKNELEKTKVRKEDSLIFGGLDGILLDVFIKKGEYVIPGTKLFEVGEKDSYYIEAEILAEDAMKLKVMNRVIIGNGEEFPVVHGKISKIYPKAFKKISDLGIEQKRVKVEIKFDRPILNLMVGYEVDIELVERSKADVLAVPKNSVFKYHGRDYVFKILSEKAELSQVKAGLKGKDRVEILEGLEAGDKIVVSPSNQLEDGGRVKIVGEK